MTNRIGFIIVLCGASSCVQVILIITCNSPTPSPSPKAFVSKYIGFSTSKMFMHYVLTAVRHHCGYHTSAVMYEKLMRLFSVPKNGCTSFLPLGDIKYSA